MDKNKIDYKRAGQEQNDPTPEKYIQAQSSHIHAVSSRSHNSMLRFPTLLELNTNIDQFSHYTHAKKDTSGDLCKAIAPLR
jgi:hypothetical protein